MTPEDAKVAVVALTPRERETLLFGAKGCTVKETATYMGVKACTAADLRKALFKRLDVETMVEAAVIAAKAGIV